MGYENKCLETIEMCFVKEIRLEQTYGIVL